MAKKREINASKRAKMTSKLAREITVAAKVGSPDPTFNPRLALAIEAARKHSVSNDVITRAIKKGSGSGADAANFELVTFEGMSPQNVPVIIECLTDNRNRTARRDMPRLFGRRALNKVMFFFDHVGIVEATRRAGSIWRPRRSKPARTTSGLEDAPSEGTGARFYSAPTALDAVTHALRQAGWVVSQSEMGYRPKEKAAITPEQRSAHEDFLERIDDHDDCHRIYTA